MNEQNRVHLLTQRDTWESINWTKCEVEVKKLQARIVKAQKAGKHNKVKALQWNAGTLVLCQSIGG